MAITAPVTMIANPNKTNADSKLVVVGLGVSIGLGIICATLDLTKK